MATIFSVNNQVYFGCLFCNQVFTNLQLFRTHFESHVAQENTAMRNLNHINSQRAPLQPNFPRSMFMQGTNGNNVANGGFQGTNLNNVGSRVPQQLGIGGALLQLNFPRSMFVQGTIGNNDGNRVFQGTGMSNVGSRVSQQLAIGGASMQPNFQGTSLSNVGSRVSQQLAIGGASMQPNFQGTSISNDGSRVSQQLAIGGASMQPNFQRSMSVQEIGGNIVVNIVYQRTNTNNAGNRVVQVLPQQVGLMSQTRTNQFSNTSHQNVASEPLISSFVAPQISQGNDAMEVTSIDGTMDYINQLNQPIDNNEFVDSANVNDETLNLGLGL